MNELSYSTRNTISAFAAVELDEGVKARIADIIESLRRERIEGLRLVRPEGVHLTLKFFGDIDSQQVATVMEAMSSVAARHASFSLRLGAPGVFPNANRARVLWVGVEGNLQPLRRLQGGVEEALGAAGFPPEKQPFNPHLTIGRMHHRASRLDRRRATDALAALPLPASQPITVNALSLMKSELRRGGAIYHRIHHSFLRPSAT